MRGRVGSAGAGRVAGKLGLKESTVAMFGGGIAIEGFVFSKSNNR